MSVTAPSIKSLILNSQPSAAQADFSQTLVALNSKPQSNQVTGAAKSQSVQRAPVKKPAFYQSGDVIYQLGKYRITAAPDGSKNSLVIYVNGTRRVIKVDTTKGKLLVGQTVAKMVDRGDFKANALSWGEQADCSLTKISNDRVYISAFNVPISSHILQPIIQPFQGKTVFADAANIKRIIERLGYAAAARGKPFSDITVDCHGWFNGMITVGGDELHASELVKKLLDSGALKKGGTVEFASCLVGQDFDGMRDAAKKYGVNIKGSNTIQTIFGVRGTGFDAFMGGDGRSRLHPELKIPVKPDVLTFTPSGKVFQSDGTQITKIEYRPKK